MARFYEVLAQSAQRAGSWLCVGLDPDPAKYPAGLTAEDTTEYLLTVIERTADVACAYKPNAAFFEALGGAGHEALEEVIAAVPTGVPVVLDGKRNDIGNTAGKYAEAAFDELGADAVTVTPYLGRDTVEPFASYEEKGVFLLARTSNPSAGDFQDLPVDAAGTPLYQAVARKAMEWNQEFQNLGLVSGATYPDELSTLRTLVGDGVPLLIPGVGTQGGDAQETIRLGGDTDGRFALVNVGRAVLYAGTGGKGGADDEADAGDWADQVEAAARRFAADLAPAMAHS